MLLNLYFSGIPGCVVKGVVSNHLFQIFLDPALGGIAKEMQLLPVPVVVLSVVLSNQGYCKYTVTSSKERL